MDSTRCGPEETDVVSSGWLSRSRVTPCDLGHNRAGQSEQRVCAVSQLNTNLNYPRTALILDAIDSAIQLYKLNLLTRSNRSMVIKVLL
ncbi:hypothetical protein PGT21_020782 [Puccinia graminis f. sp. tritici]|uniref:Uncharacterized protein n=1 Tax=Puccinia graminis f. sp. tritici TaxID=56615 RepID=A0A5B0P1J5_PUCGR|nr:hypothetical protein PGTUg99_032277 [Puccinia graminis f. sp. tritici]KAA1099800.1 hypothetical protein PGT21_020782 [Puccinia graminis f. sp. tritici]